MARTLGRLTALKVGRPMEAGLYPDGGGLYLQATSAAAKSWLFRFTLKGKARQMGLGSFANVSLLEARTRAAECRRLLSEGVDPIEARKASRGEMAALAARSLTFKEAAAKYVEAHRSGWRNAKHASQWVSTLQAYAEPVFGALPVAEIDTALVLRVLEPIWSVKPETAGRLRGRIEAVLDWAAVRGHRSGDNPARWRGRIDKLLPARSRVRKVVHHAALPYGDLPAFFAKLQAIQVISARALEFTILTAARTGEAIGAEWTEISSGKKTWTVPAARMKAGKEHRVPLSPQILAVLERLRPSGAVLGRFVFPGVRKSASLSNMAMTELLRRTGNSEITVHGFRSTFRDWASEQTSFASEVIEMALAHTVSDKVEAAYRRGDLLEKRRRLIEAWANYCTSGAAKADVIPIRARGARRG